MRRSIALLLGLALAAAALASMSHGVGGSVLGPGYRHVRLCGSAGGFTYVMGAPPGPEARPVLAAFGPSGRLVGYTVLPGVYGVNCSTLDDWAVAVIVLPQRVSQGLVLLVYSWRLEPLAALRLDAGGGGRGDYGLAGGISLGVVCGGDGVWRMSIYRPFARRLYRVWARTGEGAVFHAEAVSVFSGEAVAEASAWLSRSLALPCNTSSIMVKEVSDAGFTVAVMLGARRGLVLRFALEAPGGPSLALEEEDW